MPRRSRRTSPKPPAQLFQELQTTDMRKSSALPAESPVSNLEDLEKAVVRNWNLPAPNINTCVEPKHWPGNESDPKKWHVDIVRLLHEASRIDLKGRGKIVCSNNEFFRLEMACEITRRQTRNKSRQGRVPWMTATDLKAVIKGFRCMAEDGREDAEVKELDKEEEKEEKPSVRRGRSKANTITTTPDKPGEVNGAPATQQENTKTAQSKRRPKNPSTASQTQPKPGTKRQASDLPIRPARKLRGVKSPKSKPAAPPPVTPANPPEASDGEEEAEQENEPPEPVSGRHIYGDFIKPTTVDFNPEDAAPAQAQTRQTRKRGRAENEKPPSEVQIDSDPRDIDATGFLSELDPKEARRRRKPRLSRLQRDPVVEPAWSQDVDAPPETPGLAPAIGELVEGTLGASVQAGAASSAARSAGVDGVEGLGIEMLMELLPSIPEHATVEEKSVLEDRVVLIQRDIVAYQTSVWEINQRANE